MQREPTEWEKIFVNNKSHKGFISRVYKEILQINNKNQITQFQNRPTFWLTSLPGLVLPADLMGQAPQVGRLPCGLQTHHLEGCRDHHSLFLVIGWWDPIKHLEAVQCSLASLGLVGQLASQVQPKDAAGGSKVVRAMQWVGVHLLMEESQVLQLVSVEIARNGDAFTAHHCHLPAQQHLLGYDGRQAA